MHLFDLALALLHKSKCFFSEMHICRIFLRHCLTYILSSSLPSSTEHGDLPATYTQCWGRNCDSVHQGHKSLPVLSQGRWRSKLASGGKNSHIKIKLNPMCHISRSETDYIYLLSTFWYELSGVIVKPSDIYIFTSQAVDDKDSLLRITPGSDMARFLFYKHVTGLNNSTLVSVPFSNWYISTAEENNKPVDMCQESARRHRIFKFLPPKPEVEGGEC